MRWGEQPGSPPNFIFPLLPPAYFNLANLGQFQYLMYRPLYWFGQGGSGGPDSSRSLAVHPTFSRDHTKATVVMRPYRWSNGETVDATDVLFWMNLLHAAKATWAAYVTGGFPDIVTSVVVDSPTTLTFTFDKAYGPTWLTDNALSQITPLPRAWDVTAARAAAGSGGCSAAAYGSGDGPCTAVYRFLSGQAGFDPANPTAPNTALSTYATNPLWQVVDGPWHLKSFDRAGNVVMVPNPKYSGPVKPAVSRFLEVPFATYAAELRALVKNRIDIGYLSTQSVTQTTSDPTVAAGNDPRLTGFDLVPLYLGSINYIVYNFASTGAGGAAGPIFSQLYVRQAMQSLVDQPRAIRSIFHGYAFPTYGPVPMYPRQHNDATSAVRRNPYPYDPARAVRLLAGHGWRVIRNGTSVCMNAGAAADECGTGIPVGTKLDLTLAFANDAEGLGPLLQAERASWERAGIHVTLAGSPSNKVIDEVTACGGTARCTWQLADWGVGWYFVLDYYPTGEQIFATGALSNLGGYTDATNDANIMQTIVSDTGLARYQDYLATRLPVVFQPDPATSLAEVRKTLQGTAPQNLLLAITPEDWYFQR